jgi:lipopolysaccharide export system protein LptA
MKSSLLSFLLLALAAVVHAQPAPSPVAAPAPTSVSPQPTATVITAATAEIWSNEAQTETYAIFKGNVVVTGTNLRITCDRIDATATGKTTTSDSTASVPATGKNATAGDVEKFKQIIATGKVRIVQGDREAHCERAEVLPRESKIVLSGQPVVIDRSTNSVATGEPLTLLKDERRVLGENVKITFPPIKDLGFDKNAPAPKPEDDTP